jgi:uncharacterized tellurite resistance protein B-like protein
MKTDLELLKASVSAMLFHIQEYDNDNHLKNELIKHRNTIDLMIKEAEINRLNSQLEVADNLYIDEQKQYSKLRELLREVVMRSQLSFPENNQDGEWFNEAVEARIISKNCKRIGSWTRR